MSDVGMVKRLVDRYGDWFNAPAYENRAGGTGRFTRELYPYTALFEPLQINSITVKNRIVMAPMGNIDMCEETGRPSPKMLEYFFARARGGTGLLTTGLVPVSQGIDPSVTEKEGLTYFPRIDSSRTNLAGWRDLAQGVHVYGSKIFIQLTAGLGRVGNPECLLTKKQFPVSASLNGNFYISGIPCLPLSGRKIKKIVRRFGQAAADAKTCGMDGVYLHGHEGYLMDQLTNPAFNRRHLGRYANWQQFGLDVVQDIRERVGFKYPIMYRIDLSLAFEETYGLETMRRSSLKKFTGGRTLEQSLDYMKALVDAGVDIFDVDLGGYDNWWLPHPPAGMPAGCFLELADYVKRHFETAGVRTRAGLPVAVVAVGKLGFPDIAERALRDHACDMVMLGRPLLCDPQWPSKVYRGAVDEIIPCIGCQEGCVNEFIEGGHPQCAVNARTGFEDLMPETPPQAEVPKHIAMVGGGPAGAVFAATAAQRGHRVHLYEKTDQIGGRVVAGSVPKVKFDIQNYLEFLRHSLTQLAKTDTLKIFYNTEVTPELLEAGAYDAVVCAVGTAEIAPPFKGAEQMHTVQATALLRHPELAQSARRIVVIGGGAVGLETAYWLRYEYGKEVTVLEMQPYFMYGACTSNRGHLIHYAKRGGIRLENCAQVTGFENGAVLVSKNVSKQVPDPYNTWAPILPENVDNPFARPIGDETVQLTVPADLVVYALGGKADSELFYAAQSRKVAPELYAIGDSFVPGRVLEANRSAYRLACEI